MKQCSCLTISSLEMILSINTYLSSQSELTILAKLNYQQSVNLTSCNCSRTKRMNWMMKCLIRISLIFIGYKWRKKASTWRLRVVLFLKTLLMGLKQIWPRQSSYEILSTFICVTELVQSSETTWIKSIHDKYSISLALLKTYLKVPANEWPRDLYFLNYLSLRSVRDS